MAPDDYTRTMRRIHRLIQEKNFRRALPLAAGIARNYPSDALSHVAHSICEAELGSYEKALDILALANLTIPDDRLIIFQTAETLNHLERYEQAEGIFERALTLSANGTPRDRSECLNGLGSVQWKQGKRDDAIIAWKHAVAEDPTYVIPRKNLDELTNEYAEPVSASPTHDDLNHFQKIHTTRYFAGCGHGIFETMKEAEQVFGAIIAAWNELMAPRGEEIDRMTAAQKTELFSAVQVDYSKSSPAPSLRDDLPAQRTIQRKDPPRPPRRRGVSPGPDPELLDRQFHFLPPSHGRMVLELGYPALIGAGMEANRLRSIVKGAPVVSKEEQISFTWAHELLLRLIIVQMKKGSEDGRAALREARQIALECIPAGIVTMILKEIRKNIARVPVRQAKE